MPLIVIQRKMKGISDKCLTCRYFAELRDDEKKYRDSIAIICNATSEVWSNCFEYMWLYAKSKKREGLAPAEPSPQPIPVTPISSEMRNALYRLRRVGR